MFGRVYKSYVLGTLTLLLTLNYLDRGLVMLLLQPIKEDLLLTDTELGFVSGIAFALFYATLGIPIARWADRGNRTTIASLAIGLWGVTVMSCMLVVNFTQLVFARIAAAVGEAGCMPPTYSLVGDYFPAAVERTRAMAVYWLGSPLAQLISFIVGGWLYQHYGWRATFFAIGLPGILMAVVTRITVTEPRSWSTNARPKAVSPRFRELVSTLWYRKTFRHLATASILTFSLSLGLQPWYAAFLIRSHGMTVSELSVPLGLIFGISGFVGVALGGCVGERWLGSNERHQVRLIAVTTALLTPCFGCFLLASHKATALLALVPLVIVWNICLAPTFALMQRLVPEEMRATAAATVLLLVNLIGAGVGPQFVGILSDLFVTRFGPDSLRYAMMATSGLALWAAYHFWQAGETVKEDLSIARGLLTDREHLGPASGRSSEAV